MEGIAGGCGIMLEYLNLLDLVLGRKLTDAESAVVVVPVAPSLFASRHCPCGKRTAFLWGGVFGIEKHQRPRKTTRVYYTKLICSTL